MNKKFLLSVISIAAVSTFAIQAGIASFGQDAILKGKPAVMTREAKPAVRPAAPAPKKIATAEAKKKKALPPAVKPGAKTPKTTNLLKKVAPIIKKLFKKAIPKIRSTYFKTAIK